MSAPPDHWAELLTVTRGLESAYFFNRFDPGHMADHLATVIRRLAADFDCSGGQRERDMARFLAAVEEQTSTATTPRPAKVQHSPKHEARKARPMPAPGDRRPWSDDLDDIGRSGR